MSKKYNNYFSESFPSSCITRKIDGQFSDKKLQVKSCYEVYFIQYSFFLSSLKDICDVCRYLAVVLLVFIICLSWLPPGRNTSPKPSDSSRPTDKNTWDNPGREDHSHWSSSIKWLSCTERF